MHRGILIPSIGIPTVMAVAIAALLVPAGAVAESLPTYKLAELPDGAFSGWSAPAREGDISYRTASKGRLRMVRIKAWWSKDSLRPPEGKVYVFEVRYKDTATEPIVFASFGGLGSRHSPEEVHRFGGYGDGKWKTAQVAVGWDQLIRMRKAPAMTGFGIRANADLPVSEVKVRLATKADEVRHNAETREWVARAQAAKRKAVPIKVEPRKFGANMKLGPVVAFAWSPLAPLLPNAQPTDQQVGAPIKIRMCLNELEGGSFGVYANGKDLTNVSYSVSPLVGSSGKLIADVIPRTAEYCLVRGRGRGPGRYKWYPQRLWPAYPVDIPAGRCHWFVFNLRTHRGKTRPGSYRGTVKITADQGSAALPVQVEVLPIDLLTMEEADLFMGGCVTGLVPVHDIEFAVDYNQNGMNLWFASVRPGMAIKNDKLVLNFDYLDEWMAAAKKRGLRGFVWFLGGNPYGFPHTMTIFREMALIDTRGGKKPLTRRQWVKLQAAKENRNKPMPAQRELVVEWVRQVAAHAKAKNWPEVILTPFDEPAKWVQGPYRVHGNYPGAIGAGPWIKTYFKEGCKIIREAAPDIRIYGSIHHINYRGRGSGLAFINDVDIFCTNAVDEDPNIGEKVRAAGHTLWQYSGGRYPDRARFGYGFYFASFGSRGSLHWAYNWGPGFDTTAGGASWMYAWHTPFDTIPAPLYEGIREAWDDRRVIETYTRKFADDPKAMAVLKKIFREARRSRARGGRDTVNDFYTAIDDMSKLDRWRNTLLDRLLRAK